MVRENAYFEVKDHFVCLIKVIYYTPKFHSYVHWFLNEYGQWQINNFSVVGFSDSFPIPNGAAATLLAAVLYNLPALAQMP